MKYLLYQGLELPNPNDKEAVMDIIDGIFTILDQKEVIKLSYRKTVNDITAPDNAVYFNRRNLYIPEKLLNEILVSVCYMEVQDQVTLLKSAKYNKDRIIPEYFYREMTIYTPVGESIVDCLVVDFRTLCKIDDDLMKGIGES